MPRVAWTDLAYSDLARLHAFLAFKNAEAAVRAIGAIRRGIRLIGKRPGIGKTVDGHSSDVREWVIEFGHSAYIVRYLYDGKAVTILAIRHGREDGF